MKRNVGTPGRPGTGRSRAAAARIGIAALLAALLGSCGGGGMLAAGGVGSGGTGLTGGTVLGFGSVIVDGQVIDDSTATLEVESEPGSPNRSGVDEPYVRLGQQALLSTDALGATASSERILPALIGVATVSPTGAITVAGQEVDLNTAASPTAGAPTVLGGYRTAGDIATGDQVLVHGHVLPGATNGTTRVQATRIELQPPGLAEVRVTGAISNLKAAAGTFDIGALHLSFGASTQLLGGISLANGEQVVVWGPNPVVAGVLQAGVIAGAQAGVAGLPVHVGGVVYGCPAGCSGGNFTVDGYTVNPGGATVTPAGSAPPYVNGQYVEVSGTADPVTGVIAATQVHLRAAGDADADITGTVFDPVTVGGNTTFLLRGVPVQPGTPVCNGWVEGTPVHMKGLLNAGNGGGLVATSTSCPTGIEGMVVELRGLVGSLDGAAGTFTVADALRTLPVTYDPLTVVADNATLSLANGAYVVVVGKVHNGVLKARRVRLTTQLPAGQHEVEGIAYLDRGTGALEVDGLSISYTASVVQKAGVVTVLKSGHRVRVRFTVSGTSLSAVSVTLL